MSGSHRATAYPPYEPMQEPAHGVPQQPHEPSYGSYEPYQEPVHEAPYGQYQPYAQSADGYFAAYDESFQPYVQAPEAYAAPEPLYEPEPPYEAASLYEPEPLYTPESLYAPEPPYEPEPVYLSEPAPQAAATPAVGARTAARGRRRKAKKKSHGKAVMAGTALLVAAAAGWYTVGQDTAKPGVTTADGPGPEGVSTPDRPAPAAAAQAAADRQNQAAVAGRSETRDDGSVAAIPGLGASFTARIPAQTNQVVVATGQGKDTDKNSVTLWTRTPEGRWLPGETWQGHNGKNGWTTGHNEGDLRSPIGVFSLTDAGGRNADPGSKLPYDKDPSFVVSGTGFFGDQLAGSFDYVVAINYNRVPGSSPLDPRRPDGKSKGGGIWLHVDHDGPTHGCVSIPEDKMAQLIRTLDPAAHPVIVMGDATSLAA
ncbi:L,D-transpeptidase family protein [Kitasatospora sp. NPDC059408]|uniref:L,D-transpeptidase family protein n=1 Tax=Kitasatospora sp. NPDC059408 TaxID=3346823 RepID=UPI0036C74448